MKESGVSVIIPTYNRCDWLKVALDSVLKQTFQDLEVLLVDDLSTDDTHKVASSFSDPRSLSDFRRKSFFFNNTDFLG